MAIAIVSIVAGAAVGIAGIWIGYRNSKGERETTVKLSAEQRAHERQLARDDRLHDDLRQAYEGLIRYFLVLEEIVICTMPFIGPLPDPPDPPPESERQSAFARAATVGSDQVMEAANEAGRLYMTFHINAGTLAVMKNQHGETAQLRKDLDSSRESVLKQVRALESLIRSEVRG